MKAQTVGLKNSTGRILCCTIFRPGGKKLLAKGHVLSEEDVRLLETEGMDQVWVTELEEGEVGEDDAVMQVATEMGCGVARDPAGRGGQREPVRDRRLLRAGGRRVAAADQLHRFGRHRNAA